MALRSTERPRFPSRLTVFRRSNRNHFVPEHGVSSPLTVGEVDGWKRDFDRMAKEYARNSPEGFPVQKPGIAIYFECVSQGIRYEKVREGTYADFVHDVMSLVKEYGSDLVSIKVTAGNLVHGKDFWEYYAPTH